METIKKYNTQRLSIVSYNINKTLVFFVEKDNTFEVLEVFMSPITCKDMVDT